MDDMLQYNALYTVLQYIYFLHIILQEDWTAFGIYWNGPTPSPQWGSLGDSSAIIVPELVLSFSEATANANFQNTINPVGETNNHGIDLFVQATSIVQQLHA